jgi:hypothetical protein
MREGANNVNGKNGHDKHGGERQIGTGSAAEDFVYFRGRSFLCSGCCDEHVGVAVGNRPS